jgi:hypothetical protein
MENTQDQKIEVAQTATSLAVQEAETPQTYFIATNGEEMAKAQTGLTAWVSARFSQAKADLSDARLAYNAAVEKKWASGALKRIMERQKHLVTYYEKMLAALRAGYVLVPAFPVDVFAIRTTNDAARVDRRNVEGWRDPGSATQSASLATAGEGKYVNPQAQRYQRTNFTAKDAKGNAIENRTFWNSPEFRDITFPLIAAKPQLMNATAQAMSLKIFDEIGIVVDGRATQNARKGDPLIIGKILAPRVGWAQQKGCHFLITWHVDVSGL